MMDCKEAQRWYEETWIRDRERWDKERGQLEQRLEEQAQEILELKVRLQTCERSLEEERTARQRSEQDPKRVEGKLEGLGQPALGEGFFRHLAQEVELWDQALIEEARGLGRAGLGPWLKRLWEERENALSRALAGEAPDWRRLRTGLVLEWALLAWLEGIGWPIPGPTP